MKSTRYSYLIKKSVRNVLTASLLSNMAMQLATSIEVIIAGNYVSPDAVSVVNLSMPLISFINAAYMLLGIGASFRISRQLGNSDYEEVKSTFSCSTVVVVALGMIITILMLVLYPTIARMLTFDEKLLGMLQEFLSVSAFTPIFFVLMLHFSVCLKSIGNAKLIPQVTLIGTIVQVATALLAVCIFGMGIKGIALSGCVGMATQSLLYFWKGVIGSELLSKFSFRFNIVSEIRENTKLSLPLFVSLVVAGFVFMSINNVVASALGTDGLNIISVCVQLMFLSVMLMSGFNSAMMPIGNMMMGEGDIDGVRMLNASIMKMVLAIFATLFVVIMIFPSVVLNIFGLDGNTVENGGIYAIRIFAISIPLLAYSMMRMTCLMILSYNKLASLSAALRTIMQLVCIILIAQVAPQHLWWGIPASIILNETLIAFLSYRIYKRTPGISPLTLIPKSADSTIWSSSLSYDMQSLGPILRVAEDFLRKSQVDDSTTSKLILTIEELATNIIKFAKKGKNNQRFDLLIRIMEDKIIVSLKDDGIPFNPIRQDGYNTIETKYVNDLLNESIGLRIVNNIGLHLEHRYMYGQNIVTILSSGK